MLLRIIYLLYPRPASFFYIFFPSSGIQIKYFDFGAKQNAPIDTREHDLYTPQQSLGLRVLLIGKPPRPV